MAFGKPGAVQLYQMNPRYPVFVLLFIAAGGPAAADTAYSALRLVGKAYGEQALNGLVEVRGTPGFWKILLADEQAPGGLREVRVRNGSIRKEVQPDPPERARVPIDLGKLNLDSDGVLTTVNQHLKTQISNESAEYTLSASTSDSTPVWTVALRNRHRGEVSWLQIAANDGTVLQASVDQSASRSELEEGVPGQQSARHKKELTSKPGFSRPDIVDRIGEHVERPTRLLRRLLPF